MLKDEVYLVWRKAFEYAVADFEALAKGWTKNGPQQWLAESLVKRFKQVPLPIVEVDGYGVVTALKLPPAEPLSGPPSNRDDNYGSSREELIEPAPQSVLTRPEGSLDSVWSTLDGSWSEAWKSAQEELRTSKTKTVGVTKTETEDPQDLR